MKYSVIISFFIVTTVTIISGYSLVTLENLNSKNDSYEFRSSVEEESRLKKHKLHLFLPLVVTALMIKSIIFPLVLKAMAVMTSIAVLLSFMSLIISSIIGYAKIASNVAAPPNVKVVYVDKKPHVEKGWSPPGEYIVPPIFGSKFSYVPRNEPLILDGNTKVIDHYHTFVD